MQKNDKKEMTIDAARRPIGRVASEVAKALMGKSHPDYTPHIPSVVHVTVTNANKLRITEKKRNQKTYTRYSGHPGGFKQETLTQMLTRAGRGAAIRKAVERMLPRNTMRVARLKRLTIED